jgi:hypothetical protein
MQLCAIASLVCAALLATGCNRAMVRFPTGSAFPRVLSAYSAQHSLPNAVFVASPLDLRIQHIGEEVAGTGWKACKTDALDPGEPSRIIGERLVQELRFSELFREVSTNDQGDLELRTHIHAFCAQAVGFIYLRVAGLTAIRFQLVRGEEVLYDRTIERVVTDADPEYTGKQVATIEGAMLRVMADSLREVVKTLLSDLDSQSEGWVAPGASS